jgi:YidC/Oxa1 family membrane protein insertase
MFLLANVIEDAFSPLISLFAAILVFLHKNIVGGSWGLAIVGLTVLVRAVLLPLTIKQLRSMQNMQRMAPEIKALQAKYKDDKQRQQEELMKFYRENNMNPFASCIPLLLQLPVFISLFYALRSNLKTDICGPQLVHYFSQTLHLPITKTSQIPVGKLQSVTCNSVPGGHGLGKFLFIPDITAKATGVVLVVLLVLYVGSQLASTMIMSASADANQRRLMMFLPLVFVIFIFQFPAGVLVYWITTNLWTLGQQYVIRRRMGPPPAPVAKAPDAGDRVSSPRRTQPALAGVGSGGSAGSSPGGRSAGGPPPRPPRRKKKRSGRRR